MAEAGGQQLDRRYHRHRPNFRNEFGDFALVQCLGDREWRVKDQTSKGIMLHAPT